MKTSTTLALIIVAVFVGVLAFQTTANLKAQSASQTKTQATTTPEGKPYEPLSLNPQTWEIISPDGDQTKVAHLNTEEQRRERELADFAARYPEEYNQQLQKSPERQAAEIAAAYAILNPVEASAKARAQKTPEQLQQEEKARQAILNPSPKP